VRRPWQEVGTIPDADLYRILDVSDSADMTTIRASYRRLARRFHPDARPGAAVADAGLPEADALRRMTEINRAWEVLRDPVRRAAYDVRRAAARASATSRGVPSAAGPAASATTPTGAASSFRGAARTPPTGSSRAGGTAAPPHAPANPADGTVLTFGRYAGWSLVELARRDPDYLEWLDRSPAGRSHKDEIDVLLRRIGRRGAGSDPLSRTPRFRG
jgi:curved DNA-binding protein CbpA